MADSKTCRGRGRKPAKRKPPFATWSKLFLAHLAATSNVKESAKVAGVTTFLAYDTRRTDAEFNRKWQQALCEGYDHLEMDLLHRLRTGELKPAPGAKKGSRSFDNANSLRLLTAHREAVARQRAIRDNEDADAILASIDDTLGKMRERWLAAQGIAEDDDEE